MVSTRGKGNRKMPVVRRSSQTKNQIGSGDTNANDDDDDDDLIAICSRTTLFNEETWWMLDLDNESAISARQGATPLVVRCQREYHWDEEKCRQVLKAYRQFLFLKKHFQDWDATIISPAGPVNQMWHQHLLDVTNYCHDTMLLCGHVVGHNPDGALDHAMKDLRTSIMCDALVERFGSDCAKEMWLTNEDFIAHKHSTVKDTDPITFRLRNQTGEETFFQIKRKTKLIKAFRVYAKRKGLAISSLIFELDGELVDGQLTSAELELDDDDQIDVRIERSTSRCSSIVPTILQY